MLLDKICKIPSRVKEGSSLEEYLVPDKFSLEFEHYLLGLEVGPMAMAMNEHEEARRQQMEENKRRMEELGLMDLIHSFNAQLNNTPTKRKPKEESKPVKQEGNTQAHALGRRRSARTAARPPVDYRKGDTPAIRYIGGTAADAAVMDAMEEALTALTNPAFIRPVLHTYGAGSSKAYIPVAFRDNHMPERDERFTVEDEDQMKWNMLFDSRAGDLIRGWRAFNTHHALMAGDCCLFELVSPLRFRVQIFRYDEHNGKKKGLGKRPTKKEKKMSSKRKNDESEDDRRNVGKAIDLQMNCKDLSKEMCPGPEDADVVIDRKPKLEAETLMGYQSADGLQARLSLPLDRKPKLEAEILEEYPRVDRQKAYLSISIDKKPKVEAERFEVCPRATREEA